MSTDRPRSLLAGPWLLLVGGVGAAVLLVCTGHLRVGANVLGATLALTALLRAVLPLRLAGAIAVRSRLVDVLLLTGVSAATLVLAATLRIPD